MTPPTNGQSLRVSPMRPTGMPGVGRRSPTRPSPVREQREELAPRTRPVHPEAPPGAKAALLGPHPVDPVDRAPVCARVDPVEPGGVETEDASLGTPREGRVPELLLHGGRDHERLERVDLPLRRAPPDRVGPPRGCAASRTSSAAARAGARPGPGPGGRRWRTRFRSRRRGSSASRCPRPPG